MANYEKGKITKNALYQSAARLFYEKGYCATTVKDIVKDSNTKLGLFTYYFTGKEQVAFDIFQNLVRKIPQQLKDSMGGLYPAHDLLLLNMVEYRAYLALFHLNERYQQFYLDISRLDSFVGELKAVCAYFIELAKEQIGADYMNPMLWDKGYTASVVSLSTGMEIQFLRDIFLGNIEIDYEDALDLLLGEYYRFLFKDKKLLQEKIRISRTLVSRLRFCAQGYFQIGIFTE